MIRCAAPRSGLRRLPPVAGYRAMGRRLFCMDSAPGREFPESRTYFCHVEWPDWRFPGDYVELVAPKRELDPRVKAILEAAFGKAPQTPAVLAATKRFKNYVDERFTDRLMAWEFLHRNPDYQRAWIRWSLARDRDNNGGDDETYRLRNKALLFLSETFGINTDFEKPPDPFRGDLPVFQIEGRNPVPSPVDVTSAHATDQLLAAQIRLDRPIAPQLAELEMIALRRVPIKQGPSFRRAPNSG